MKIDRLDHLVLTVRDMEITCAFYRKTLGMQVEIFGNGRRALVFGNQKINLHEYGQEPEPRAARPTPGSADLCFITRTPLEEAVQHLRSCGVETLAGPVARTGATGQIISIYLAIP